MLKKRDITACRSYLKKIQEYITNRGRCANCNFAVIGHRRESKYIPLVDRREGAVCHGSLQFKPGRDDRCIAIITASSTPHLKKEDEALNLRWLKWVLNDSPYAHTFHTKRAKDALYLGVIQSAEHPGNMIMGGLHMFRAAWEGYQKHRVFIWDALVNEGVEANLAWLLVSSLRTKRSQELNWYNGAYSHRPVEYPAYYSLFACDHDALDIRQMSVNGAIAFIKGQPTYITPPYKVKTDYHGVFRAFEGRKTHDLYNWLEQHLVYGREETKVSDEWGREGRRFIEKTFRNPQEVVKALKDLGELFTDTFLKSEK